MVKVILVGNVGRDPEIKTSKSGESITTFSVATTERRQDRKTTQWHKIVCFGKLADFVANYLQKGMTVAIEGKLSYREYEKDGSRHCFTEIIADNVDIVGQRLEQR